jgi:HSP20 family protein
MAVGVRPRPDHEAPASGTVARKTDVLGGGFFWPGGRFDVRACAWSPSLDLIDRQGEVVLRVDLPGIDRADVQLTVEPGMLHLRGVRSPHADATAGDSYQCAERWFGRFARALPLSAGVDTEQMTATLEHGVLEVRLPKRAHATGQTVPEETAAPSPGAERPAGDTGRAYLPGSGCPHAP